MSTSHIDLGYLTRFCKGDRTRMERYIRMYLDSAPGLFAGLEEHAEAGDAGQREEWKDKVALHGR